jgi:hypothetical protein
VNSLPAPAARVKPSNPASRKPRYTPTRERDRKVTLAAWLTDLSAGALRVVEDGEADTYFLQRLDSDFGDCFRVEKWRHAQGDLPAGIESVYDVCLDGEESSCECRGFLRHGHCRHLESLTALLRAGKLPSRMTCTATKACA